MNGKGMHTTLELRRERFVHHAVALDPALPFEGPRHDINPEVRLAAGPVAGMTLVLMRFVEHAQAFGRESLGQLLRDEMLGSLPP